MNLLITGAWKCTPEQLEQIKALGHTVVFMQNERDALPVPYETVEGVICNGLFQHHPIEKFTALRYIQVTSAGLDRVPVDYVHSHGIVLHNAKGVYSIPMAEFAVSCVLQFYKQTFYFEKNQRMHRWDKHRGLRELYGNTVCILGCGDVGTECAKRFLAFGCKVIGVNRSVRKNPFFDKVYPMEEIKEGIALADVVVVSVALTSLTRHLLNDEVFSVMKDGCILVNIARGPIIDTDALMTALKSGRIYAAMDVFDNEPLDPTSPLWDIENVILTPHNSFVGDGNANRLFAIIKGNLHNESK